MPAASPGDLCRRVFNFCEPMRNSGSENPRSKRAMSKRLSQASELKLGVTVTGSGKKKRPAAARSKPAPATEVRLARFLPTPNSAVKERISRAFTHRLYLIDKKLSGSPPSECEFFVLGATGNVYTVRLALRPSCTCPDYAKGNICKHILFVMLRVMRIPQDDPRVWQKALLPSELDGLLENLSVSDAVLASGLVRQRFREIVGESSSTALPAEEIQQKPQQRAITGDCPICYEPMAANDGKSSEPVVFCKTCGNNVHADCFKRWSQSKKNKNVTCIYCRAAWETNRKGVGASCQSGSEYINLASYSEAHMPDEITIEALYPSTFQWFGRRNL
ncbi:hypothetical protein KP509_02G009400 [Ceratopteris richardii]|uniref:Mitogen-activated protein kinase kinase kinase 1 n=1 Tax=Ceratopteris richardii TaxID=49495 RepID=A0A8T2V7B5_CERRI|nr:hypothetical protein KP509_02G009400 [Ceratopteris richardii]